MLGAVWSLRARGAASCLRLLQGHIIDGLVELTSTRRLTEIATHAAEPGYSPEMSFVSSEDALRIPIFRTLSDEGVTLGKMSDDSEDAFHRELAVDIYRTMVRLNITDSLFYEAQRQGRLSFYLTSFGEEATTVGSAAALDIADEGFLQYREQGFLMWRGFTIRQMADQCFGNALECGKGRQMPVHYSAPDLHVHTISSVLATQIPHAVGAAFALKVEGKENVAVTFFGDGAASEGDFHASLNFAATLELPIIFICRNNGYAISTPTNQQFKPYCVGVRGQSYGIQTVRVDGGDPRAVYLATREARRIALQQNCPILIEDMCYRSGHHSTSDDSSRYRSESETMVWKAREPIGRFFQFLCRQGWWSHKQNDALKKETRKEVIAALDAAEKVPKPPVKELFTDVYATMPWNLKEQHEELLAFLKAHPDQRPSDVPLE